MSGAARWSCLISFQGHAPQQITQLFWHLACGGQCCKHDFHAHCNVEVALLYGKRPLQRIAVGVSVQKKLRHDASSGS